jgi:hypothetical protein
MKHLELRKFIQEEIISILNEDANANKAAADAQRVALDKKIIALQKTKQELSKGPVASLEEEMLDEMAYNIRISDPEKLSQLKDKVKDATRKGEILLYNVIDSIEKAVEAGRPIRQADIKNELGVIQQQVNPIINQLIDLEILSKSEEKPEFRPRTASSAEPKMPKEPGILGRKPKIERPKPEPKPVEPEEEEDVEVEDEYEKISPEDTAPEVEPEEKEIAKMTKSSGSIGRKSDMLVKVQRGLKQITAELQDLAKQYKAASKEEKPSLIQTMKDKTEQKKELEKQLSKLERF